MAKTHIWLDADSCPLQVRNFLTKKANEFSIEVTFVANKKIEIKAVDSLILFL